MMNAATKSAIRAKIVMNVLKKLRASEMSLWSSATEASPVSASVLPGRIDAIRARSSSWLMPGSADTEIELIMSFDPRTRCAVEKSNTVNDAPIKESDSPNVAMPVIVNSSGGTLSRTVT